ncbi:MAG TPA: WD40 repeat domain-containing protein [Pyrinomonadaceae bacterium]|nr:WD40 repeat domain-containing protein [Pyrinomonadaceae bacterium]
MKQLNELVTQKLSEILIRHGRAPLTDAKLCENLLKDYCGEYKEEIHLLVFSVRERIPSDLLTSHEGLPRELLRGLLVKRLRKGRSLSEGDARWIVDSWSQAIRTLLREEAARDGEESESSMPSNAVASTSFAEPTLYGAAVQTQTAIRTVACSPFGDEVAFGGDERRMYRWTFDSRRPRVVGTTDGPISSVAYSPNGVLLASANEGADQKSSSIRFWDLRSGEMVDLGECGERSPKLAFSPGGKSLACASAEETGVLRVWNLQTGQMRVLKSGAGGCSSISFSPDGKWIAAADSVRSNPAIRLWDLETGTARVIGSSRRQITSVAFSPDGKSVASGSWDETLCLWNVQTGEARVVGKNCSCICCLAFSPAGDKIATCSLDGGVRVWNLATMRSRTIVFVYNASEAAFRPDNKTFVIGDAGGNVSVLDAAM